MIHRSNSYFLLHTDENDYVIVSGADCDREPEFIPDGPKNALHHMLQVRGHRLPEYSSVRDGESNWTATAILHLSRHKTITVKVTYCTFSTKLYF